MLRVIQRTGENLLLRRLAAAATALLVAGGLFLLYVRNPAVPGFFPPCPFLFLTGLYCPGCGALRTLHELMHFHFAHALELNVLVVISALPLGGYLLYWLLSFSGVVQMPARTLPKRAYYAVLVILLAFWFLRNLPWFPFSLLAPH